MSSKIYQTVNNYLYILVTWLLLFFSLALIFSSIYNLYINVFHDLSEENITLAILQWVWSVVIWVAIADVAKYMYEEEIVKNKELTRAKEARETLTKIIVIISIAVAIEGLIYIFKAWIQDIRLLVYPSILIISSSIMIVGLWIYHKLTVNVDKK